MKDAPQACLEMSNCDISPSLLLNVPSDSEQLEVLDA